VASSFEKITELLRVNKLREFLGSLKNVSFQRYLHRGVSHLTAPGTTTTIVNVRSSKHRKQVKFEALTVVSLNIIKV
jgi:hypothetical protein